MIGAAGPFFPFTELLGVLHDHAAPLIACLHECSERDFHGRFAT
jgi:hypothetical protein